MHARIIHNNNLINASQAALPSITATTLYGRGVFTTLAVHKSRPFLWSEHWSRLTAHAARVEVDCSMYGEESVSASLKKLIEANKIERGRARITLLAREVRGVWKMNGASDEVKTDLLIMTGDAHATSDDGLALTISPYRINTHSPLLGLKSTNYLERIISWEEARGRDFDEAVVLNERGEIVSATLANIFWVTDGKVHTPALSTGALAGTTRGRLIALAEELAIPVIEGVYDLSHLNDADEIFLTSSGLSIALVNAFDFHRYTVAAGSVALRVREAFRQLTLQSN